MDYRREIDGLRAIAIVPVVFFHAGLGLFHGGFVGVDVFFVISGYLITSIILAEMDAGAFTLARFYERRIRRLLPALLLVLAVSTVFAMAWLLPGDLSHFFRSVSYTAVFASNYRFYRISDYFAPEADLQPLVHTWSLAIEEQYYLVFPLLLLVLRRLPAAVLPVAIALLGVVSFVLCQRVLRTDPSAAFFLTPYRVWELMIGSLVAVLISRGALKVRACEAPAALGLAMILGAALLLTDATPFPGAYALAPTIGAALVILYATPQTWTGRLLGSRAFVGIGLVSYSAYLWHQPLFAFAKLRFGAMLTPAALLGLVGFVFLLAWATWLFVEQPFRKRRAKSRVRLFAIAGGLTASCFALGHAGDLVDRHRLRGEQFARVEHVYRGNDGLDRSCRDEGWTSPKCRTTAAPEVLIWGDSYAMHLVQGFTATDAGGGVIQATKGACPPVLGIAPRPDKRPLRWSQECLRYNDSVLRLLRETPSIRYVAMSSFLTTLADSGGMILLKSGQVVPAADRALEAFVATLDTLVGKGITPVVFAPPPQNGRNIGRCQANAGLFGGRAECAFNLSEADVRQRHERDFLRKVEARGHRVVWLDDALCPGGVCSAARGDIPVYRDSGHLTVSGSEWLGREMQFSALVRNKAAALPERSGF